MSQIKSRHSPMKKSNVFILALDPFIELRYQKSVFQLTKAIQAQTNCTVEPVFVLGASGRGLVLSKSDIEFWLPKTKAAFSTLLKKFQSLECSVPKILIQRSPFLRSDVKALVSYAKSRNANAIIVGTQLKSAIERGVLGSFTETLLLSSAVPVIAVPPKIKLLNKLSPILFPTDFGLESSKAFERCIQFAKNVGATILLFHEYALPVFNYPAGVLEVKNSKWKEIQKKGIAYLEKVSLLEKWKNRAIQRGVKCQSKLTMQSVNIADAIISENKNGKYGMIAMVATRGPGKAWFTGSTPRWVLRNSRSPVWVYFDR